MMINEGGWEGQGKLTGGRQIGIAAEYEENRWNDGMASIAVGSKR